MLGTPRVKALSGLILLLALVGLGVLARSAEMTQHDLHIDRLVEPLRFPLATAAFSAFTAAATEVVGVVALACAVGLLVVRGRRWDACRLVLMAGSSWALALAVKALIHRPRPPASLWVVRPDPTGSFPSGHDTTASIVVLIALVLGARLAPRLRIPLVAAAAAFALAVGASRIYLGDHYPTDVVGSYLVVAAASMLVWAATDLPGVRRSAARLLRSPGIAPEARTAS